MAAKPNQSVGPLLVIVGPTASGKTALAIELAKKFDGEIVCADSRTVYKGMDIGTAKPTVPEQEGIPHHLLDLVSPNQSFNVTDFKCLADKAIADILARGKLPILVGGSGLYIDAVIYDYDFANASGERDAQNPRHLHADAPKQVLELRENTLVLGMQVDPEVLRARIEQRVQAMVDQGLLTEIKTLDKQYSWDLPAMQAPAYKAFRGCLDGSKSIEEASRDNIVYDSQLARKQRTWFKRNNSIHWLTDPRDAVDLVTTFLNKAL